MLKRSLTELAAESIFSSRALAAVLRSRLLSSALDLDSVKRLAALCRRALAEDLDTMHARRFRLNDLGRAFDAWWPDGFFESGKIPLLDELFDQLMMRNGDFLQYRVEQVQAYARMALGVEPTLLAGWHLAQWMHANSMALPHDVKRVVDCQLPFYAPPPSSSKHYAEGHVHIGGISFDGLILMGRLSDDVHDESYGEFLKLRQIALALIDMPSVSADGLCDLRRSCRLILTDAELNDGADKIDWQLLLDLHAGATSVGSDWLRAQLARSMLANDWTTGWRWYVTWLWYVYQDEATPAYTREVIYFLFASLMQIRRKVIMDGRGLTRFTRSYYNSSLRKGSSGLVALQDSVRRLFVGRYDWAEVKIKPDDFTPQGVAEFARAIAQHSAVAVSNFGGKLSDVAVRNYVEQLERWHFCAHFLRRQEFAVNRASLWTQAERFLDQLAKESGWNLSEFLEGHLNVDYRFQPGRWLRGLDIAGDENAVRSEVFAPVLRWLRRGLLSRPFGEQGSTGFHLSVHAGEDYPHPLSGLRHVDETVLFCGMRSGDRIGHGLALGIEPAAWVARQGDMILPVAEHLDNLVWAWHYACELSPRLELATQIIPRLERRIARFAREVPWLRSETGLEDERERRQPAELPVLPTPDTLYRAWALRRNCYLQFMANYEVGLVDEKLEAAAPDHDRLRDVLRRSRKSDGTQPHPHALAAEEIYFRRESARIDNKERCVLVRQPANDICGHGEGGAGSDTTLMYDYETAADLSFMCAVQDYLLDKYDRMGLIIEANPSSNVSIGHMETHSDHPIFRWYPPNEGCLEKGAQCNRFGLRRGPIKVLVNTDDPGIFPTTLRTEFALLGEAAIDLGHSQTSVEAWLDRLRQFGLDEFCRNHLPIFERENEQ
ncbi:metallo-dependent hydrolase [Janthinobacterium sp. HH01]|uniref:antiviral RADAR system adenosine deaminase RdrB n=1 Tax=Janthinobacterium sp. HH01 TaxID=1198452 RepID=UPI0002AEC091|nr:antiviral RADAR system adenosine deaminase RdrB [Janthinobacterium sp. HH01]ELX09620.1 metallo-dependent hydrolase [Janthinobacterium sp. HH01]